jgi:hypothetical protein
MTRILAFIENDMYVRNFITSEAFGLLIKDPEFGFCLSEIVSELKSAIPSEKIVGTYDRCDENIGLVYRFNKLSMRALRKKSKTFDIKVRAGWMGSYGVKDKILSSSLCFNHITKKRLIKKFRNNPSIEKIIKEHKPDLVIFPMTGVESTGVELINLSRKYGFKTFFLINGWDNLSSKGIFPLLPDHLGVWGLQSALDAVNIHGMLFHRVIMLGCARYEPYFVPGNSNVRLFSHPYILFAGGTTPNDEITPLRILDDSLNELGNTDIKIVYRPHPWREKRNCFDTFDPASFKHVVLDPQVADNYYGEKRKGTESVSSQNFPALTYYPSLVNHALFVVSPMSSMTLEAALFDVPGLVLAYDDGYHPISGSLQAKFNHFEGGDEVPGWYYVRNLDNVKSTFRILLERFKDETPVNRAFRPTLSLAMKKYIHQDDQSYAERLREAIDLILTPSKLNAGSS